MSCMFLDDNLIENGHKVKIISTAFFHKRKIHRARKFKTYVINENLSTPINESSSLCQFDVKCILAESKSFLIVVITIVSILLLKNSI